jgi:hypothetical protein
MNTTSTARRAALTLLAGLAVGLAAACGPAAGTGAASAPSTPDVAGADSFGVATEPTAEPGGGVDPGPTDISPTYPDNAEAYAKAVVAAWVADQPRSLGALTSPAAQAQILALLPTVNDQWTFGRCDGTAGSSYCSFTNADGDVLTVRITHSLLSKAHAAIEASLDKTVYPNDGVSYVKAFVGAWQTGNTARMLKLSSPAIVATVKTPPSNPSYPAPTCCGGGLLQVKVVWSNTTHRFDVGTTKLGGPNAIVDYVPGSLGITS